MITDAAVTLLSLIGAGVFIALIVLIVCVYLPSVFSDVWGSRD